MDVDSEKTINDVTRVRETMDRLYLVGAPPPVLARRDAENW